MRQQLASLALLCLHVALAGCALVPIPLPLELTGPVNGVRVLDAQTKEVVVIRRDKLAKIETQRFEPRHRTRAAQLSSGLSRLHPFSPSAASCSA